MNRPNKKDFFAFNKETGCKELLAKSYIKELEKYCDYLESKGDCTSHYERKIQDLEKTLNKACDKLETLDSLISTNGSFEYKESEEWKEWCMNDD